MKFRCAHCGKMADKPTGAVNRAREAGLRLFCGRRCSGLGCRKHKTKAQRKEEKRLYDIAYRAKNLTRIKAAKKEHHKRTYDPLVAAVKRKKRSKQHAEYCRRPEYREWKQGYDQRYRATKFYGEFAEAAILCTNLNREIKERSTSYEISQQNETFGKRQKRQRAEDKDRPRRYRDPGP